MVSEGNKAIRKKRNPAEELVHHPGRSALEAPMNN
jgi:hypothetical protein